jgi:TatD DNase family protein
MTPLFPDLGLWTTAGIHPLYTPEYSESECKRLEEAIALPGVVAVGETGLDYAEKFNPNKSLQRQWFKTHLQLAADTGKALFLHEREAFRDFVSILEEFGLNRLEKVCVHCFSGSREQLETYLDLGFYIGITGIVAQKRGAHLLDLLSLIPLDRLVLETDAPYLTPQVKECKKYRRRNEPCCLPFVARAVADQLDISVDELTLQTHRNSCNLFGIGI